MHIPRSRLLGALALSTVLSGPIQAAPIIDFLNAPASATVGSSFTVDLQVSGWQIGFDELLGFGFDISDDGFASFNNALVDSAFLDDSAGFANTDVAGSAFPGVIVDPVVLAQLTFFATNAGIATLGIVSDVPGDINEGLLLFSGTEDLDATFQVTVTAAAAPIPSTLPLMSLGLLAAWAGRRRGSPDANGGS